MTGILKINPSDNVLVALHDLKKGERVRENGLVIELATDVPAKHKFAVRELGKGDDVIMYGILVGKAEETIPAGAPITVQNVKHSATPYSGRTDKRQWSAPDVSAYRNKTFMGYHRPDGQVGVANYWIVVPLVFCENRNVHTIRMAFEDGLGFGKRNQYRDYVSELVRLYRDGNQEELKSHEPPPFEDSAAKRVFKNIDGIKFLTHQGGCGGTRDDAEMLCALIAGYVNNPNVAGATVLSLGCQNAQVGILRDKIGKINPNFSKPLLVYEQQREGTERDLLVRAIRETFVALAEADKLKRAPAALSKLKVGLECGGSDGFSGISANPSVGYASDLIVALGGSTILSEFPELCGVEQELINRCTDDATAGRFIQLMRAYSRAAEAVGSGFDMNPSPGNIKDGLITDAMKSAGAAKKGGTSPVTDVLDYGEYVHKPGLNLLCTPGNDVESTTAMAGAGASLMLFTTGLGTPTGNPIAPVIKISSNTRLAKRMPDIIDIDTGPIIEGKRTIEEIGRDVLDFIIEVASGNATPKAVGLGQDDFIPWKRGVSL